MCRYALTLIIILFSCTVDSDTDDKYEIVYVGNEARQCEYDGLLNDETAQVLTKAGIDVIDSECGYIKGKDTASVCGGATTEINVHTIKLKHLADAEELGYKSVSILKGGYGTKKCSQ
jgi:hypothetical protein